MRGKPSRHLLQVNTLNGVNMSTNTILDQSAVYIKSQGRKSKIRPLVRLDGPYGYIDLGDIEIGHEAGTLASILRRLASELEPKISRRQNYAAQANVPAELASPETAWPYLVQRFPWLFEGIETGSEPYADYLKEHQLETDLERVADLGPEPALADLSERLFSERSYGGARYKYLKKLQNRLKVASTPHRQAATEQPDSRRKAA